MISSTTIARASTSKNNKKSLRYERNFSYIEAMKDDVDTGRVFETNISLSFA